MGDFRGYLYKMLYIIFAFLFLVIFACCDETKDTKYLVRVFLGVKVNDHVRWVT